MSKRKYVAFHWSALQYLKIYIYIIVTPCYLDALLSQPQCHNIRKLVTCLDFVYFFGSARYHSPRSACQRQKCQHTFAEGFTYFTLGTWCQDISRHIKTYQESKKTGRKGLGRKSKRSKRTISRQHLGVLHLLPHP